jgi:hypothetical protein
MEPDSIAGLYNPDLKPIEDLLAGVRRFGDFFVRGELETPMPRMEVAGVGVLSFPVPETQARQLIQQATRAPYGRGEKTLLDETVRKVWQVIPDNVSIGGKSWDKTLKKLLTRVVDGLGCAEAEITAELYKLLLYDEGGFFKPHRDTEKTEGMIGTLVVVLPSEHAGGDLVIRHGEREIVVDLSTTEVSELRFAAFYADCEHEVRPVTKGNRVCLVYNLIQRQAGKKKVPLEAPLYDTEAVRAARMLRQAFSEAGAPRKVVWLLEHQYSPAGLSFDGLKGEDAALAKVLCRAAKQADCAVHLCIVHIEETGPAELNYEPQYGRRRRWGYYDDEETQEDVDSGSFEVVEISDARYYVDQWRNLEDQSVAYGELPLAEGEVLPAGALDDEEPDEQRIMEATGNEGASFERSYHRAALVIWPRDRYASVLIQAGVGAALPYLAERIAACRGALGDDAKRQQARAIAGEIIKAWEASPAYPSYRSSEREADRAEMVHLLGRLGDVDLLKQFIRETVTGQFDGSETEALASSAAWLGSDTVADLFAALVRENMRWFHRACVNLLHNIIRDLGSKLDDPWKRALGKVAAAIVAALPKLESKSDPHSGENWWRTRRGKPVDSDMVSRLLDGLRALDARQLRSEAVGAILQDSAVFIPDTIVLPALANLQRLRPHAFASDQDCVRLWQHAAGFLLSRNESPPRPPSDWKLDVGFSCECEDCEDLRKFALDPNARVARFRVRKDRRQHLHGQIERHDLDMTHATERKGSPQTLVCTKTRRTYRRLCEQHRADCAGMEVLLKMMGGVSSDAVVAKLGARLAAAKERKSGRLRSSAD